ncbi:probable riboflavin synthase, alpha chain [Desulfotalea psychrophila LSv54]|uniref:Riboflavin synthase n=2 Tax=Desulfotalea psychrophila TaxID=84980 RepID=Q6AP96_DESPS|nr:probable riboflavin synthase, alpha chain [Desulfotalea psychrophila LSv54]
MSHMFTGIVQGKGKLLGKRKAGGGLSFDLEAGFDLSDPQEGESIAICGVCLTAYNIVGRRFLADVSPETLSRTRLGRLNTGDAVNMERALQVTDRLGGHIVSGHVDCLASLSALKKVGNFTLLNFSFPTEYSHYMIEKGSVTIDGVSLTINDCGDDCFSVSIIPQTLRETTLGDLVVGSRVNIEVDIIGKYVEKLLKRGGEGGKVSQTSSIDTRFLAENGFL